MTKMEKQTIYNALVEYVKTLDDKVEKSMADRVEKHMAEGILTYWGDVVNAQSGTVTI